MPIEETIEQKGQEALAAIGKTGGKVLLKASKAVVVWLLANGWNLAAGKVKQHLETGQISERQLQLKGEDVHITTLPQESLKQVGHHLRKNGIDYAIEKNDDGTFNLMFQGKDNDHIDYLVTKAFNECGIDPATIPNGKVEGIDIEEDTPEIDHPEHTQKAERDAGDEAFDQPEGTTPDAPDKESDTRRTDEPEPQADHPDETTQDMPATDRPAPDQASAHDDKDGHATPDEGSKSEPSQPEQDEPTQAAPEVDQPTPDEPAKQADSPRVNEPEPQVEQPDGTTPDATERGADDGPTTPDHARTDETSQPTRARSETAKPETKSTDQPSTPSRGEAKPPAKKTRKDLLAKYRKETAKNLDQAHKARSQSRSRPQPARTTPKTNSR